METRIRYKRSGNILTSNKTFDVAGRKVQVTIDLGSNVFEVKDISTNEVLKTGKDKTGAYVKKAAKSAMQELGLQFSNEKRNRGPNKDNSQPAA